MAGSKRLLVIIDPTTANQPCVDRAAWLARGLSASVELFVCAHDPFLSATESFDPAGLDEMKGKLLEDYGVALETLAEPLRTDGLNVSVDARWDHPLEEGILRKIHETDPRIVFKDTHYHSVIERSLFSGADWDLMRRCPVPLWLVKDRQVSQHPTIVAAIDPVHREDKSAELDRSIIGIGLNIAAAAGGELFVFHCFDSAPSIAAVTRWSPPLKVDVKAATEKQRHHHLEAVRSLLDGYAIAPDHIQFHEGTPHDELVGMAIQRHADVVVLGSGSRSARKRASLGSTARRVLDHLPCDLMILKPAGFEPLPMD